MKIKCPPAPILGSRSRSQPYRRLPFCSFLAPQNWGGGAVLFFSLLLPCLAAPDTPIHTSPTDAQWMAQSGFSRPAGVTRRPSPVLRVHGIESLNADKWGLAKALDHQYNGAYRYSWSWEERPGYGFVRNQIKGFPADWQALYDQDVVVDLGAGVGQGLSREQRGMLAQWVKDGGGLLLLGGYWTFGSGGGWAGTVFDDLSPVTSPSTSSLWDWQSQFYPLAGPQPPAFSPALQGREPVTSPPSSPSGAPMTPAGDNALTQGLAWNQKPLVMVSAKAAAVKPGATVLVEAQGTPIVVVWHCGKGRVAAILAQPLGEAQPGNAAFWDWPDWPVFLGRLVRWLRMSD